MINPLKLEGSPCAHARVVLDQDERTVHCSRCGLILDAFDVLTREATRNANDEGYLAQARGELARLHGELSTHRKNLARLRKSVDNENRKLNRLIERRKDAERRLAEAMQRAPPQQVLQLEGEFEVEKAAAAAARHFE